MITGITSENGEGIDKIKRDMAALLKIDVLVGIPEEKAASGRKTGDKVNNAQLMYIHTNGSALRNIPARPVIQPAIEAHMDQITEQLKKAARLTLAGEKQEATQQLKKVGLLGAKVSKEWFIDPRNGWAPNSRETILRKLGKMQGKKGKKAMKDFLETGATDEVKPLIDTGALRQSIITVVRYNGGAL